MSFKNPIFRVTRSVLGGMNTAKRATKAAPPIQNRGGPKSARNPPTTPKLI